MKRIIIHGLLSLGRRLAKTGMLFVILFVVFSLVFTGFIIQNSIARSKDYIRDQIGSAVEYRMDYTSLLTGGRQGMQGGMTMAPLSIRIAEKIAENPYVEQFYITESANMDSETISPAQTANTGGGFQRDFSSFTFSGSSQPDNLDFVLGNVVLKSGRTLTADDIKNGSEVVIISDEVATQNNLLIGDFISLYQVQAAQMMPGAGRQDNTNDTAGDAADYEVIGIYQTVEDGFSTNTIFTSNTVIHALMGTAGSDETNGSIVFLLDSPDHVDAFKAEASPYLTSEYHVLYSDDTEYESLTKPLNLLSFITSILIWVVFVAGAAIILALVTIFVRDRKFEIGLLLSSGEGRMKIVSQFVLEILVIAIVAFGVSAIASSVTAQGVSNWIVDNQLLSQSSLITDTSTTLDIPNMMGGRNFMQSSVSLYGAVDMQNVADKFDVSINTKVISQLMLASIALVLIGSSIPLVVIMGYKPRQILQDDN
ncbi:MAG: FtsX-like permease family protein [Bacillota bacterium]|nr:FtsX-like permease family protein [Bacillota bacterium]